MDQKFLVKSRYSVCRIKSHSLDYSHHLRSLEVSHPSLPLPVPVSGWLWTLWASDLASLGIDTVRELGQRVLLLGRVSVGLLFKFP